MAYDNNIPILLNCRNRRCLIIGGGRVAARKASTLLDVGANVHIVSPVIKSESLQQQVDRGQLRWDQRTYGADVIQGAFLVHAATNDAKLNLIIAEDAERLGILVNVSSDGGRGSFTNPTVMRRGRLILAVSTSGAGPIASMRIRDQLEEQFGEAYESYLDVLYRIRATIKSVVSDEEIRRRLLDQAYRLDILGEIERGNDEPWSTDRIKLWIENNQEE
ncbi:bifunctional precorrin-2 dehydrogenase/sirohydrochlorin ferrochelatase [Paenibacillus sp. JCM 10914]|uniref:precorrin-2 dehydrogenase/sirohydrochlorin ferrochelatase family protein n=1 Tax=Paenibacillus sp. JCM 10914 TaxID=1236974 RepID=UPI0003CC44D6|nr:NAD(P)-dependent oxidoreductase [Paenibacillus sp. JCM 10914]GAE07594.1 siroheme synthase [Paenibacillus sp. JCM 10914]